MKILLMGFSKLKLMPYLHFYLDSIDTMKHEVHVLYWNRDLQNEPLLPNVYFHEFCCYQEDYVAPVTKIGSFLKYRHFARTILKSEHFDVIVALHTMPAILLMDVLRSKEYIFDYRDVTYENIPVFRKMIGKIVRGSVVTFVSSDGFRKYLPQDQSEKIYTSHNLLLDSLNHREYERIPSDKIRISFWGNIRDESMEREIIGKLAGDLRFEIHYYGRKNVIAQRLEEYAKSIGGCNIYFSGEYLPEERYQFACKTDLIHNIYGYSNSRDAMTNKYYDSLVFRIPQMCLSGTYMGFEVERGGTGVILDPFDANFADYLFAYSRNLKIDKFNDNCDIELARILEAYYSGVRILKHIFGD